MSEKLDAVIFDRDGTLFSVEHHMGEVKPGKFGPLDWGSYNGKCADDCVVPAVAALWHALDPKITKIITSGREDHTRANMVLAMDRHDIHPDRFFMRKTGDNRKDSIVKSEIYAQEIEPHYNILFVVDDRLQVVEAWRALGLKVIAVTDPGGIPSCGGVHA